MRQIGVIFFSLFLSSITFGQIIKIQGGTSLSKLDWQIGSTKIEAYNGTLIGYSVFGGIDYLDMKFFNLSSNIGFIRKGGKGEIELTYPTGEPTGETTTEKPKLDYFSMNTFIDFKYPITEELFPFISIGPRFDLLLSKSEHFDGLNEIDALNSSSYGFVFGGGLKYVVSKLQIGIKADYYLELNKLAEWPADPGNIGGEVKTKTFTINFMVGYILK